MLRWLNVDFKAAASGIDETPRDGETPSALTARLARAKAHAVDGNIDPGWILAADTVVALAGVSLGKPADAADARSMLRRLRENVHPVHTGVTLYDAATDRTFTRRVTTEVWMRPYSDAEIETYIASGDPFDKAGGYAIQHAGFAPVARVDRCYANVMGLPLCAVIALLRQVDCDLTLNPRALCQEKFAYDCPAIDEGERV
jgi:septum formation protein